ncbi:MoxR family ATPase [Hymenobacter sp. ASUV-10]|uniref:MoxR family ATPase n=1 Tax=Hymenobacter aranciens TaxID=3063996 RepID=A0ABT9B8N1_9BACT|nr:MoxR family ATPase [Hymenobacter sp. ASUV-10]MDO7874532.1 MoxR family ATPase [Hymenobacter sp. ASUV-10]
MTPTELADYLDSLIAHQLQLSVMIWGPPGIGKSSIVAQAAERHGFDFIDVRLSQLAPTDLRGLPVADTEASVSRWLPPEFLPRSGQGILFLDELNLAPPAMQGMAQQLILDRRVGSYVVPAGWYIWAAGNRKEDRAAVFDMPAPLANRFLHLEVGADWESFKGYALGAGVHEQILAFLAFRPALLHQLDAQRPAWPSPRSWVMASRLHHAGLSVESVVGAGTATEFTTFLQLYASLPALEPVLEGKGKDVGFPAEPSARYATTMGLTVRARTAERGYHGFEWLSKKAPAEWLQLYAVDLFKQMRAVGQMGALAIFVAKDEKLRGFLADYQKMVNAA